MDKIRFVLGRDRRGGPAARAAGGENASGAASRPEPESPASAAFRLRAQEIARAAEGGSRETPAPARQERELRDEIPFGLRRRLGVAAPGRREGPSETSSRQGGAGGGPVEPLRRALAAVAFDFVARVMDLSCEWAARRGAEERERSGGDRTPRGP